MMNESRLRLGQYSIGSAFGLPNDVDRGEEADPDDVDEVPVDARGLDREVAVRRELTAERSVQADPDEHDAPGHVRAVEAGEGEEHAGEHAVPREEAEARVLVRLAADEGDAEDERRDEPLD